VHLSVIVVDWHQPTLTRRAVGSVLSQRVEADVEVVLVVNEADDDTLAAYREDLPSVVLVPLRANAGFAGGVAAGVSAAHGDVLVFLNNDAVADHGFLDRGAAVLRAAGDRTAAVAATVVLEGGFVPAPVGEASPDDLVAGDGRRWRRDPEGRTLVNGTGVVVDRQGNGRDRDWLRPLQDAPETTPLFGFSGGAAFVRRDALDAVGGFDPFLFMYYEDLDVSWRLRLAGFDVRHAPDAVVVHRHAASSGSDSPLVRYQSMRNRLAVVLRNASAGFAARVLVRTAVRAVVDVIRPSAAQLTRAQWARLVREAPAVLRHARRARRGDRVPSAARRAVETAMTGGD
jgi:GT2 family glycosyltransferase